MADDDDEGYSDYYDERESEDPEYEPEDDGDPNWIDSFYEGVDGKCDSCDDDDDP